jgi:serine-type D-Ala-D-Ala carboxypeptidase (penicillin-binding protein 5/6)
MLRRRPARLLARPTACLAACLAAVVCLAGCGTRLTATTLGVAPPSGPAQPAARPPGPAGPGVIGWPDAGTSAADISGIGVLDGPGATRPVPIASVAKLMTAFVILQQHPLSADAPGPDITVEPSEAAAYPAQAQDGDSLVAVASGEVISERQALEALLLPSADNMAWILARWDAGSQAAFTAAMNAAARRLGMTGTRYTDPSGLDPATVSSAADQVRLGMAAMRVPALAEIAGLPATVVPVAGAIRNTNTLLGQDGIVGLKTGSTQAAGGCLLTAAWEDVRGHDTLVVAAAFGQPGSAWTMLPNALRAGGDLVLALGRALDGSTSRPGPGAG